MEFQANHPILFIMVAIIIAAVLGQSIYFLVKSYRRAKEKGMDMTKIHKTIKTAAIFTIAPAISIVITVITLQKSLGLALPWLRLSVVGSLSYETVAAASAASGMETSLSKLASFGINATQFVTIAIVMSIVHMVSIDSILFVFCLAVTLVPFISLPLNISLYLVCIIAPFLCVIRSPKG